MEMILASCQAYDIIKTTRLGGQQVNWISLEGCCHQWSFRSNEKERAWNGSSQNQTLLMLWGFFVLFFFFF